MKKKNIALVLACILCVGIGIGGTLAWLTATSGSVTNTFTTSDIDITLTESTSALDDKDDNPNTNSYQMVPGYTIEKDPKVTVTAGSEKCYLFVELEKSANFDSFMTYEPAAGWTPGEGIGDGKDGIPTNVYYRVVEASTTEDQEFQVIKDDTVTVKYSVTKTDMNGVTANPTLKVTAYASQYMKNSTKNFTAAEAWNNISNPTGATT